jgi:hypothetical protein
VHFFSATFLRLRGTLRVPSSQTQKRQLPFIVKCHAKIWCIMMGIEVKLKNKSVPIAQNKIIMYLNHASLVQ